MQDEQIIIDDETTITAKSKKVNLKQLDIIEKYFKSILLYYFKSKKKNFFFFL
jgi:hypothetical protein